MQFTRQGSEGILGGRITVSFRNWKRPHAAVGGVYRLRPAGAVKVTDVRSVRLSEIEACDLRRAGFDSIAAVAEFLRLPESATVTRVEFELTEEPAAKPPPELSVNAVVTRLQATDRRSAAPWTANVIASSARVRLPARAIWRPRWVGRPRCSRRTCASSRRSA